MAHRSGKRVPTANSVAKVDSKAGLRHNAHTHATSNVCVTRPRSRVNEQAPERAALYKNPARFAAAALQQRTAGSLGVKVPCDHGCLFFCDEDNGAHGEDALKGCAPFGTHQLR